VKTEIEWLRRGPKARTGKSKARIGTANAMIGKLKEIDARTAVSTAGIDFDASQRKTKRLVEFKNVACDMPAATIPPKPVQKSEQQRLFTGLNFILTAGMKVGLSAQRQRQNHASAPAARRIDAAKLDSPADALRMVYFRQMRELTKA